MFARFRSRRATQEGGLQAQLQACMSDQRVLITGAGNEDRVRVTQQITNR